MESYSHGEFTVSGIIVSIGNQEQAIPLIQQAWKDRIENNTVNTIIGQSHPSMHAIYYNYNEKKTGYDMMIGVMTDPDALQTNKSIYTRTIPAQDYRYVVVEGGFPDSIGQAREKINKMTGDELPRSYGYDLEMYNEAGTECTIAVSV